MKWKKISTRAQEMLFTRRLSLLGMLSSPSLSSPNCCTPVAPVVTVIVSFPPSFQCGGTNSVTTLMSATTLISHMISVCKSGCMDRKKTETGPDRNQLQPDHWLRLPAFQNEKTTKRPVAMDRLQSVATGFRYALKTHTFWAYFEEKQARNACAMAKWYVTANPILCDVL